MILSPLLMLYYVSGSCQALLSPCAGQRCWLQQHLCPHFGVGPVHLHRTAPTARSPLSQNALGKGCQGIYTISQKTCKECVAAAAQPGNFSVTMVPGDKSPDTDGRQETNSSCLNMILTFIILPSLPAESKHSLCLPRNSYVFEHFCIT